jgi:hypothetical protein
MVGHMERYVSFASKCYEIRRNHDNAHDIIVFVLQVICFPFFGGCIINLKLK